MVKTLRLVCSLAVAAWMEGAPVVRAAQGDGWEQVQRVSTGTRIRVTLFDGGRATGALDQTGADTVRIMAEPGDAAVVRSFTRQEVRMVERLGHRSWHGTAIGTGIGALTGLITLVTVKPKDARTPVRVNHALPVLVFTTGVGAAAGAVTDLVRRPRVEVIYVAPAPGTDGASSP